MVDHAGRYAPLSSSSESEKAAMPGGKWMNMLAHRRVRHVIILAVIIIAGISLTSFFGLPDSLHVPAQLGVNAPPATVPTTTEGLNVNWSEFAYVQYVTNSNYLCNSLMILEALHRTKSKTDRIMMYPEDWKVPEEGEEGGDANTESKLLAKARDLYGTKLVPIKTLSFSKGDPTWKDSYTKLLAFNQTQYKRVMSLDSDATVQDQMDELFLSPSAPVAMPRAYWLDQPFLSSQLVLVEPSKGEWKRVEEFMNRDDSGFDMDILNTMYKDSCVVLPHRRYNMISGELRGDDHKKYLGSDTEVWDGAKILKEAKFVHFSDWPVPKPWLKAADSVKSAHQPKCVEKEGATPDCTDRDLWLGLYQDFSDRRQRVCGRSFDNKRSLHQRRQWTPPATSES